MNITKIKKMRELDDKEKKIVRELIRDPRISDNAIGKKLKIPIMTVNRKRKRLEDEGALQYLTHLDTGKLGTGSFPARQFFMIKLKLGITMKQFEEVFQKEKILEYDAEHVFMSFLCEKDSHLIWAVVLRGGEKNEINEYFNGTLVPILLKKFGHDSINSVQKFRVMDELRYFHNYMPEINIEKGRLKKSWPDEMIFID